MKTLTLQVNDSGSWRNVVKFPDSFIGSVKEAALTILIVATPAVKMRIFDGERALAHASIGANGAKWDTR